MSNILKVKFCKDTLVHANPLYQYDYGQKVKIFGLKLPAYYEVHFSNYERGDATVILASSDEFEIPDIYLQSGRDVYIWIYLHAGDNDGETEYQIIIPVIKRAKPTNEAPTPEEQSIITETIAALNDAVTESREGVERVQQIENNVNNVYSLIEADKDIVYQYKEDAKSYAEDAANEADRAEQAATHAESVEASVFAARDEAVTASNNAAESENFARSYAEQTARDKSVAENAADNAVQSAQEAARSAASIEGDVEESEVAAQAARAAQSAAESARNLAQIAQASAESSAIAAAGSATNASQYASSASASATVAGQSAISASQSATTVLGAVEDAQQAAQEAAQSVVSIEGDVEQAEEAARQAEAAKTDAEAARVAAETAKDGAVTAKQGAEAAATNAGNSAGAAAQSAQDAETAKTAAAGSASDALAAKNAAELAQQKAEEEADSIAASAAQIEQNRQDIADQKSALMDISSVISINGFDTLEAGYWSTATGSGGTSLIYVRTKQDSNLLNYDVVFVEPSLNIAIALLAYSGNTYIGAWNGTGWEKASYKAEFGATSYNLAKFKANYPTYSFRLVLRYVDGSNIDLNVLDGNFFFEKNVLKEIDKNAQDIADIKSGKNNLYDGITLIPGRVYNGVYSDAITTIHCTDYLPITPGRIYAIYGGYFNANYSSYYDANKIYKGSLPLDGLNSAYPYTSSNNFLLFTAPSDAAFTRINYFNSDLVDGNKLKPVWFFRDVTNLVWARKKVLVMGDSISTDVYGGYKKWVTDLLDESFFTTGLVTNNSQHATGFVATYASLANTTFISRLTALGDLTGFDVIITFGGINDWIQSIDFDTFKTAVDAYFAYLIENATQARIIIFSPLHTALYGTTNSAGKTQKDYADYIKAVAKDYAFPCLNLTDESGFCPDKSTTFNDMWTLIPAGYSVHDGVHPVEEWEKDFLTPMIKGFLETIG